MAEIPKYTTAFRPLPQNTSLSGLPIPGTFTPRPPPRQSLDAVLRSLSYGLSQDIVGAGKNVANALMAPGNALRGQYSQTEIEPSGYVRPFSSGLMDAASNMAGVVTTGAMPFPRPVNSLGMGGNTIRNLNMDSPYLWRDMNSENANQVLMNNLTNGPGGQIPLHWSDVKDLAIGQHGNSGIRMKMGTDEVYGHSVVNSKPGLAFVQNTGGGKEFVTSRGASFAKVDEVHVGPEVYRNRNSVENRNFLNRMDQMVDQGQFTVRSPDNVNLVYTRVKK